ncbi:MAG: NAD-glutamate dehydrogenase [Thermoleophilaceae bacterium]|nr:NAD-glutamate dehydrogenase [Thermoleophilaceae bacterium]
MAHALDVDETLIDTVCSRLRKHLNGDDATRAEAFARQYYRWVSQEDIAERRDLDLYGAALAHFDLIRRRAPGDTKVRIYNPQFEVHGWESPHTTVEIVTDDMPFLIDSIGMELNRRGFGVHLIIHPVIQVRRDGGGRLLEVLPHGADADGTLAESVIHLEVARQTDPAELEQLEAHLVRVIDEVRAAVTDWPEMRARVLDVVAELGTDPPPLEADEVAESRAFLAWLEDHNFVFLGYREYELSGEAGELSLVSLPHSGLGILRQASGNESSRGFDKLPPAVRSRALEPYVLNLTKANSRATVHRPVYLDYVGVKRFDAEGRVIGERRFLGLYTHTAYQASPREIPMLRRKVDAAMRRAAFPAGSHDEKALLEILEGYPRDELFQISTDDLFRISIGILHLGARQRVRLFVRRDTFDRFISCLVYVPRDRFNTENRRRIERILTRAAGATSVDYTTRVSESVLVRLHFLAYVEPGTLSGLDERKTETLLVAATRSWGDDLEEALLDEHGEERGAVLYRRYGEAFPPAYRADWVPRSAVADISRIEELDEPDDLSLRLYRPLEGPGGALRAKVFRAGPPLALSDLLPLFEDMGVEVADERPYAIGPRDREGVWIYDFGLTYSGDDELETDRIRDAFQNAFIRAWRGDTESDGYNRLVLRAGLTWREATVLRAIGRYLRQAGTTFSDRYVEQALVGHPRVARLLVDLVLARFDPQAADSEEADRLVQSIEEQIDAVESLDQDRILRSFLGVLRATLRTNFFQRAADGTRKPYLSFKLDPEQLPWLPLPRPRFEIFVYSPRTEGVHLRGGKVARGGIRWSDRREDFRTEVLGLMKAQMVKNAVIVPVGAKGGFVVKRPPPGDDRDELVAEGEACYRIFISGMLDLTDNIAGQEIEPPPDVVRYDEDDPYLVVAADKGTASLSDVANGVAGEYGFWLGDAFASGGSSGYDHKQMGITARGAWESVKRHFRERGHDVDEQDFTVVGIGDMSGDVFGNGMLLSKRIRLIGAFDHRHVFLDPDPDAARGWDERRRLFELKRSSWADYDRELISQGGGLFSRAAKSIPLSPQIRAALDVRDEALAPNDLIRALLRAPVDLLWNGGIGTYVKAKAESHADAGDKANDAVRVDGAELRCHVVSEGGNLGLTQRARIEYARGGGRINTDAIDNSAGVETSDREVNIKVLLDQAVAGGDLTRKQRDELLVEMTPAVAELVLTDNYEQTETLSLAEAQAAGMVDVHTRFLEALEHSRKLDRELEALPSGEELAERSREDRGLTRPELAVALAYSKIDLYAELLDSDVPEDPHLSVELDRYFPAPLPERFADQIRGHRLRREIIATQVINNMEHGGGITFPFRLHEESGAPASEIARAYAAARDIFGMRAQWAEIEALDNKVAAEMQVQLLLEGRRLVERGSRWLLAHRSRPLDIGATVHFFSPGAAALAKSIQRLLGPSDVEPLMVQADEFEQAGVPPGLASRVASMATMFSTFDIVEVATDTGLEVAEVAAVHFRLGERLELHWLRDRIVALPRDDRWRARARAALRDDLYSLHRSLTAEVLRDTEPGGSASGRVEAWVERNPASERCLQTLAEIRVGHVFDTTTLPVAVREVRNMLLAGARS